MGTRAVDADDSTRCRAANRVGNQSIPIVDVVDMNLLELNDIGGDHQIVVDRNTALVVQLSFGHRRTVNLGLEHNSLHKRTTISLRGKSSRNQYTRTGLSEAFHVELARLFYDVNVEFQA